MLQMQQSRCEHESKTWAGACCLRFARPWCCPIRPCSPSPTLSTTLGHSSEQLFQAGADSGSPVVCLEARKAAAVSCYRCQQMLGQNGMGSDATRRYGCTFDGCSSPRRWISSECRVAQALLFALTSTLSPVLKPLPVACRYALWTMMQLCISPKTA